ncbi:MAG: hypothetical protein OXG72_17930, partial [Acidobacteria bacterium]|nr:hypothetical protein [Acidobacteriota bacterium]
MNDEPIKATDLVAKTQGGLSRYRNAPDTLTELSGRLEDVETTGENDAWIVVRPVDGLPEHNMATATIRKPTAEIDQLLEGIGRDGRITLVGMAAPGTDGIARLRMTSVRTFNGPPIDSEPRSTTHAYPYT